MTEVNARSRACRYLAGVAARKAAEAKERVMRLIHRVIEEAQAVGDEEISPLGAALEELLSGERGSLPELADRFTNAGLGYVMASWIGHGANLPVTPAQLRNVLGEARVQDLATLAGLPAERFLERLSRALPVAVHRMTPEGSFERTGGPARPR